MRDSCVRLVIAGLLLLLHAPAFAAVCHAAGSDCSMSEMQAAGPCHQVELAISCCDGHRSTEVAPAPATSSARCDHLVDVGLAAAVADLAPPVRTTVRARCAEDHPATPTALFTLHSALLI